MLTVLPVLCPCTQHSSWHDGCSIKICWIAFPKLNKWKLQILNPGQDTARGSMCKGKWFAVQMDLSPRGTLVTVKSSEPMIWHSIPSTPSHLSPVIHTYLVRVRLSHSCIWWVVSISDILRRRESSNVHLIRKQWKLTQKTLITCAVWGATVLLKTLPHGFLNKTFSNQCLWDLESSELG